MAEIYPFDTFCGENRDKLEIFEDLFKEFMKEVDYHRKTRILHTLVETYLLHFKKELETNIKAAEFLDLLSQIPVLCSKFLHMSTSDLGSSNEVASADNVDDKVQNLESASLCFDVTLACLEAFGVLKQGIVIVKISLNILFQGFTHCKDSEMIYQDLLEEFAEQLGSFFKKIESLQVIVLQQLNDLNIAEYDGEDQHVNCIILEMGNLCQVVFDLDADIAFELWAKYNRVITNYSSLNQISNIDAVSKCLALKNIEIFQTINFNQDKHSEEDEEVSAKLFFYLDALSCMMNLSPICFKGNLLEFKMFLSNLLECLVSCYSPFTLDKTSLGIIKSSLVKNAFVFLSYLYADEEFLQLVLQTAPDKQTHFGTLLLKLCALQFKSTSVQYKKDFLKDVFSVCLSGNNEDDMKFLYNTVPQCTLTKTDSDKLVTLYQFAYEQITEFSKLIPDSDMEELESVMLSYLISSSDVIYLLISDIWMFRLRYGSIEFLKDHCYSILKNLSVKDEKNIRTDNFLKRLLRFLPTSYRDKLLQEFSFWKFLPDNENNQPRFGVPYILSIASAECIYSEEQVESMICKLKEGCTNDPIQLVQKACICIKLFTVFLNFSDSSGTLQFVEISSELFKTDVYEIQIEVLTFLKALTWKKFPEHTQEFGKIVESVAKLFSEAIHSKNYIVRYEARNVFSYFAKNTSHIKIFQETVKRDLSLKPIMKSYLNALPDNNFLSEKEKFLYLKQMLSMSDIKFGISPKSVESLQQFFSRGNFNLLT